MSILVVDLDGTLAEPMHGASNCMGESHSKESLMRVMDPVRVAGAIPRRHVVDRVNLAFQRGTFVAVITGRWDHLMSITKTWLVTHGIKYNSLCMRRAERWQDKSVTNKWGALEELMLTMSRFDKGRRLEDVTWLDDDAAMIDFAVAKGVKGELIT